MPVPVIETARLSLRGWRDDDIEPWVAMHLDPRVTEFFSQTYTRVFAQEAAARMRSDLERDGYGWWVVEQKDISRLIGAVCLRPVPFEAAFTPADEIGWRLAHEAWGQGFATEAARAALEFAFNTFRWTEIVAFTASVNHRSERVMQRLAMTHDPSDDFDHPLIDTGSPFRRHLLYRIQRG
jgi:RimJ/RimL family protein N-acetyltransferase